MKFYKILILLVAGLNYGYAQNILTFEVKGMSCQGCANTATTVLNEINGVDSAYVNFDTKQGIIYSHEAIRKQEIKSVIASKNFEALFEGESITRPLTDKEKEGLDIEVIKGGEKLDFKAHVTTGKLTIFDFYADWCGPCKLYSPKLERLVFENPDLLRLKKVDVVDWKSELAKQLTKQYKLPALPFTLIFDDKGKLIGRVESNDIEAVSKIIRQ